MMKKWTLIAILSLVGVACAEATDSPDTDPADDRDASFLVDGRADTGGIQEGSAEAQAVLTLVNTASFVVLDDDASLDRRAAQNIVDYRAGADQVEHTADDQTFETLVELDAIPYVGPVAFRNLLEFATRDGLEPTDVVVHGILEGSRDAELILAAANTLDYDTLNEDVRLDRRAAQNIVDYRAGLDGVAGNADDRSFASLTKLDQISYVASRAFGKLLDYATANDLLGPDDGQRPGESSDPFSDEFCTGEPMTTPQAIGHFADGAKTAALGAGSWHVRERTCNELTGCGAWTNIRNDYLNANVSLQTRNDRVYVDLSDTPINERSVSCTGRSVDHERITCSAFPRSYGSHTNYSGRVTDHCMKLGNTKKTNPNSRSTWKETEHVFTLRFAASTEREFEGHTTPNQDAEADSPFAASSCDGHAMSVDHALTYFSAGGDSASFASGEWHKRERTCNELTGCKPWDETQGHSTAHTTLEIRNSKVYMTLSDTPINERSISCTGRPVDHERITCSAFPRSYGSHTNYRGRVTEDCTRLENVKTTNPNSAHEYRQTQWVYFQNH